MCLQQQYHLLVVVDRNNGLCHHLVIDAVVLMTMISEHPVDDIVVAVAPYDDRVVVDGVDSDDRLLQMTKRRTIFVDRSLQ